MSQLKQRLGIYAVYGNHDVFADDAGYKDLSETKASQLKAAFEQVDIKLLADETVTIRDPQTGHRLLFLSGIRDLWQSNASQKKMNLEFLVKLRQNYPATTQLLLSHQPLVARDYQELNAAGIVDLVMSGHTHGGDPLPRQVFNALVKLDWPKIGTATWDARFTQPGLYQVGKTQLLITAGLKTGPLGKLFNRPPAVHIIELTVSKPDYTWHDFTPWRWAKKLKSFLTSNKPPAFLAGQRPIKK